MKLLKKWFLLAMGLLIVGSAMEVKAADTTEQQILRTLTDLNRQAGLSGRFTSADLSTVQIERLHPEQDVLTFGAASNAIAASWTKTQLSDAEFALAVPAVSGVQVSFLAVALSPTKIGVYLTSTKSLYTIDVTATAPVSSNVMALLSLLQANPNVALALLPTIPSFPSYSDQLIAVDVVALRNAIMAGTPEGTILLSLLNPSNELCRLVNGLGLKMTASDIAYDASAVPAGTFFAALPAQNQAHDATRRISVDVHSALTQTAFHVEMHSTSAEEFNIPSAPLTPATPPATPSLDVAALQKAALRVLSDLNRISGLSGHFTSADKSEVRVDRADAAQDAWTFGDSQITSHWTKTVMTEEQFNQIVPSVAGMPNLQIFVTKSETANALKVYVRSDLSSYDVQINVSGGTVSPGLAMLMAALQSASNVALTVVPQNSISGLADLSNRVIAIDVAAIQAHLAQHPTATVLEIAPLIINSQNPVCQVINGLGLTVTASAQTYDASVVKDDAFFVAQIAALEYDPNRRVAVDFSDVYAQKTYRIEVRSASNEYFSAGALVEPVLMSEVSATSIDYKWNQANASLYRIVDEDNVIATVNKLKYTESATPDTQVTRKLIAIDGPNQVESAVKTIRTLAAKPANVRIVSQDLTKTVITWDRNGNPEHTRYAAFYQIGDNVLNATVNGTQVELKDIPSGSTFEFFVRAINGDGIETDSIGLNGEELAEEDLSFEDDVEREIGDVKVSVKGGAKAKNRAVDGGFEQEWEDDDSDAVINYNNGAKINLPKNVKAKIVAKAGSLKLTSNAAVPFTFDGFDMESTSGEMLVTTNGDELDIALSASDDDQVLQTGFKENGTKTLNMSYKAGDVFVNAAVPPSAFTESVKVALKVPNTIPNAEVSTSGDSVKGTGIAIQVNLDKKIQPVKTVPLTVSYNEAKLNGVNPEDIVLARYDEDTKTWLPLPTVINKQTKRITGLTNHFSLFQAIVVTKAQAPVIGSAAVYPNPLRPHVGHTQMTFQRLSANTSVKIYTIRGELVREISADASGNAIWDGRNRSGDNVASGAYLALIEGGNISRKILTVGVER